MCSFSNLWQTPSERRENTRAPVAIDAELRRTGRTAFKIKITDLSRTGCRCDTLSKTHEEEKVMIALPGLAPIPGYIRWANNRGFGLEWEHAMHEAVYEHICTQYPDLIS